MKGGFESEHEPFLSDEELLEQAWEDKREKVVGTTLTDALYIGITSPDIDIENIAHGVLTTLAELPAEDAYNWSRHWGRTKVVLDFDMQKFRFLSDNSSEAMKTVKLLTDLPVLPSTYLTSTPQNRKYFFVLNDEPCPIEGVVLETERMVDELVWCLSLKYRKSVDDPIEAFRLAICDIRENGFDIYPQKKQQILDLRRHDDRYQIRMYGNQNHQGKAPQVLGAVGPLDNCERPTLEPIQSTRKMAETIPEVVEAEKLALPDKPFINMGICVAKQPHIGHMMLALINH